MRFALPCTWSSSVLLPSADSPLRSSLPSLPHCQPTAGIWLPFSLSQSHSVVPRCIQKKISHFLDGEVGLPCYIAHCLLVTGFKQAFYIPVLTILACPELPQIFPSALTAPSRFNFVPFLYLVSWCSNNQSVSQGSNQISHLPWHLDPCIFFFSFYHLFSLQRPRYASL